VLLAEVKSASPASKSILPPNTHRKYEAVLNRFGECVFRDCVSIDAISGDDLTRFVVTLRKDHGLGSNTILHNAVIVAQFLKREVGAGSRKSCRYRSASRRL
jgi:hypothetical protein